jgi:hypothetical protein
LSIRSRRVDLHPAKQASKAVNISLTLRNWLIGSYISEFELRGFDRAGYGERLLASLPPDKQQKAIDIVLKQAEVLSDYWVEQHQRAREGIIEANRGEASSPDP